MTGAIASPIGASRARTVSMTGAIASPIAARRAGIPLTQSANFCPDPSMSAESLGPRNAAAASAAGARALVTASIPMVACCRTVLKCGKIGPTATAPRRPSAASVFAHAPRVVSAMTRPAPPIFFSTAPRKSSRDTFPSVTIFRSSSVLTPIDSLRYFQIGIPRSASWFISCVVTFWLVATLPKIEPISSIEVPAICAVSATRPRYRCRSLPGLIWAASADAAVVAAASRPNAVPLTAASASLDTWVTVSTSAPRALSFACASSIARAREMPFLAAIPAIAAPIAPTAATPVLPCRRAWNRARRGSRQPRPCHAQNSMYWRGLRR